MNLDQIQALISVDTGVSTNLAENEFEWLKEHELVRASDEENWELTGRGRAFLEHIAGLPLPKRVTVWRIAPNAGEFADDLRTFGSAALHINGIDEEGAPPAGPPPKPFASGIEIPTDPELLKIHANNMLDRGMSMGEVTRELNLTPEQATSFFRGS